MKTCFLIVVLGVALWGCKKDETLDHNIPERPEKVTYDLDGDAIDDITIEYINFTWDGINSSGMGLSGTVYPLNGASVLSKSNEPTLFIKINDTIKMNMNPPFHWETNRHKDLVTISDLWKDSEHWPAWHIHSPEIMKLYFLGIKINTNDTPKIGWIQLQIDESTGAIKLTAKKFTTTEYIIAGK